jgi:3-phosphoshikimate 1-carboxyvinyltransferase
VSESIEIHPLSAPVVATVRPPGSKSITNRALVCAALARGESRLMGTLDSEDTRVMIESLRRLGIVVDDSITAELRLRGCEGKLPAREADLFVGNSGTTIRFLTALVALGEGRYRLDGVPRMRERPIQDLLAALAELGVDAQSENGDGCPPVVVRAQGLPGGAATIRGNVSSQFLSGLLMASPCAARDVELTIAEQLVSQPYVEMTRQVMSAFGVDVASGQTAAGQQRYTIATGQRYEGRDYQVEPDASAASYFWAAAAIAGGRVAVEGLHRDSLQGDVAFCECLRQMGCRIEYGENRITAVGGELRGIDVDMGAISDTVQTLAAVALFASGPTTIRGVAHIRHKETDRIAALASELGKLGAAVEERPDGLRIEPGELRPAEIETYDDHRMAMSLALVGLKTPGVTILNPRCVEKTYPRFFEDLARLGR